MKKAVLWILIASLLLGVMPALTMQAEASTIIHSGTCGENLIWKLDNKGLLTISGTGEMYDFDYKGGGWNEYFGALVSEVIICDGVTSIGDCTFHNCDTLVSAVIPDSVVSIGEMAFYSCGSLKNVQMPTEAVYIGEFAFSDCKNLMSITIPRGITEIPQLTFSGCNKISSIVIPDGVLSIGYGTFEMCSDLSSITIPQSVERIAAGVFGYCSSLKDVYYSGTEAQWNAISIGEWNEALDQAMIHYNSVANPTDTDTPFTDVKAGAFYYDSVLWAVEKGITSGTSATTFSPAAPCTRAQVVTFLWRANGSPEPKSSANPFQDVKQSDYFYKAVLWAVEEGITNGVSADRFAPGSPCTRGQVATFLWRTEGAPKPESAANSFTDINSASYYYTAVLWAVEENITNGVSTDRFAPNSTCTRGQIVTFLYRAMTK